MALKPHIDALKYQVGFFVNAEATPGGVLVSATSTPASGTALDNAAAIAEYAANPSGRYPIGVLLDTFVNKDLTEQSLNRFKSERQVGDKASILQKGEVVTDRVVGAASVWVGQPAYLGATGYITPTQATFAPQIGRFLSRPDQDGYTKIFVDV